MPHLRITGDYGVTTEFRIPSEQPWRASLRALGAAALGVLCYEATKLLLMPDLTVRESGAITVLVGAVAAGVVTFATLRHQAKVLRTLTDIEARRARLELRQQALAESEARYRLLVEASPQAIAVHRAGRIIFVNPAGLELLGVPDAAAIVGRPTTAFLHPDDLARLDVRELPAGRHEYRVRRPDGSYREVEAASVVIAYEGSSAVQTVLRDVSEQRQLERRLAYGAFHDALTGLPNRALFHDRLEQALTRAVRSGHASTTAVLFLDLDDFKSVNDRLGHAAGDRLLIAVAARLQRATREYDTVARFGGDEFAVLLEGMENEAAVLALVQRIHEGLQQPLELEGRQIPLHASIGIAHAHPEDDAATLLRNADVAMYEAKESGKARHAIFALPMYEAIIQRLQLETDLREALSGALDGPLGCPFSLVYQPVVELSDGSVRGLEALVRWRHPQRGTAMPSEFISVAEETGLIVPLGAWVLRSALGQLSEWRATWELEGRDPDSLPAIGINISGRQLSEPDFVSGVAEALRASGAPARQVILEITESVIMQRTEATLTTLRALRALGVRLAIDDFGTGYSSLSFLQKFPVDVLKIDRSFVEGVARGGSDAALARTIVALGRTLGLRTVAEGIEDEAQWEQLQRLGCDMGQGYLIAPPLNAHAAEAWLAEGATGGNALSGSGFAPSFAPGSASAGRIG